MLTANKASREAAAQESKNNSSSFAVTGSASAINSTLRDRQNAYIHLTYTKKDFPECLKAIDEQLRASGGQSEYPLYVKGNNNL